MRASCRVQAVEPPIRDGGAWAVDHARLLSVFSEFYNLLDGANLDPASAADGRQI
jgi:hypothetical protein